MKRRVTYPGIVWRQRRYRVHNFIASAVLLMLIALGSLLLRDVLTVYEQNQPRHIVDKALARVNAGDYTLFMHSQLDSPYADETPNAYSESIKEALGAGRVQARPAVETDPAKKSYNLYVGDVNVGLLTLRQQDGSNRYGFQQWEIESCPFTATYQRSWILKIQVPAACQVTVDGERLDETHITQTIRSEHAEHLPEDSPALDTYEYEFVAAAEAPEIVVTDENGAALAVTEDESGYSARRADIAAPDDFAKMAQTTMETIAQYSVGLQKQSHALRLVQKGSAAEKNLIEYGLWDSAKAAHGRFESFALKNYTPVNDQLAFCDVSVDYICTYAKKADLTYHLSYTLYFSCEDGKWLLYDFVTH